MTRIDNNNREMFLSLSETNWIGKKNFMQFVNTQIPAAAHEPNRQTQVILSIFTQKKNHQNGNVKERKKENFFMYGMKSSSNCHSYLKLIICSTNEPKVTTKQRSESDSIHPESTQYIIADAFN